MKPFVDLKVEDSVCQADYEPLFTTEWYTENGYEVESGTYDETTGEIVYEPTIWTSEEFGGTN